MNEIQEILNSRKLEKQELVRLLQANTDEAEVLFRHAAKVKAQHVGNKVYFRGLIEFSNICRKNCLYCGIRQGNEDVSRYDLPDEAIVEAAVFSWNNRFGSVVLQSGECMNERFTRRIETLLQQIHARTNHELGITLSVGEQSKATYERWRRAGAHRYLLRIEASNKSLYEKLHPGDRVHGYESRLQALKDLQDTGYQTGTGVMIGAPFQSAEDMADDLLFFREFDIDMVGMGPYIEHEATPLYQYRHLLKPQSGRFFLTLKMTALLRIMMPDINIAAATALQAIDPVGREKAMRVGANVVMPNVTPAAHRADYALYENKPCTDEGADECVNCLDARIRMAGNEVAYGQKGHPLHYYRRTGKSLQSV